MSKVRPLIAVIDDEEPVRKALGRLMQSVGMTVETFSGGGEFLAALDTHRPDCAVLDLHMPEVTGFDVLERIAEMGARVPVVAISGYDLPDAEECAMRGGAAAYLRKPVNQRLLLAAIAAARQEKNGPGLHEKGGKEHEMPVHHLLEQTLNDYIAAAGPQNGLAGAAFSFKLMGC
jgi:FixJ family two-component response regulator